MGCASPKARSTCRTALSYWSRSNSRLAVGADVRVRQDHPTQSLVRSTSCFSQWADILRLMHLLVIDRSMPLGREVISRFTSVLVRPLDRRLDLDHQGSGWLAYLAIHSSRLGIAAAIDNLQPVLSYEVG